MQPFVKPSVIKEQVRRANGLQRPLYLLFIATKPCYIKLASLVIALHEQGIPFLAIEAGQHYEDGLTFQKKELSFDQHISITFSIGGSLLTRNADLIAIVEWLCAALKEQGLQQPAIPIVSGDTATAGFLPAYWYLATGCRSIHIEAGLRSLQPVIDWQTVDPSKLYAQRDCEWIPRRDEPFPEGMDSRMASTAAQLFFAPVRRNALQLFAEGYSLSNIHTTGSLSADAVKLVSQQSSRPSVFDEYPFLQQGAWVRVDIHRRENFKRERLLALLEASALFAAQGGKIVWVMSNGLRAALAHFGLLQQLECMHARQQVYVTGLWSHYAYVLEFMQSDRLLALLTDSGGLQEEAAILGVRCLTCRFSTDRPETISDTQNNLLLPPVSKAFVSNALLSVDAFSRPQPSGIYGSGVAAIIAAVLNEFAPGEPVITETVW